MFWFKNLKVRYKLLIAFTIIIALAASAGTYIITGMKNVNDSYADAVLYVLLGLFAAVAVFSLCISLWISGLISRTLIPLSTFMKKAGATGNIDLSPEKGSRQMDEMISAVKAINEASKSISKIIKTIDDIAFQTNILALNAAVEAARAGQHGKGFAVVAEEVRNLAAKSAEAAKETGDMIQNSMEKAEFGSSIAGEPAVSLTEIVSGINESSRFIAEIARASEDQTEGISQINIGIDQVAQVVAQNSATAQESAAASAQMSNQAAALEELLGLFKMKEEKSRNNPRRLIASEIAYC